MLTAWSPSTSQLPHRDSAFGAGTHTQATAPTRIRVKADALPRIATYLDHRIVVIEGGKKHRRTHVPQKLHRS